MTIKELPAGLLRKIGVNRNSNKYILFQKIYWALSGQQERYRTFSQFGEDQILRAFFPEKIGSYLDIGGGNYRHGNNTYFLYKKGWSGIVIEPITAFSRGYKLHLKRDKLIPACFATELSESRPFYEFHPWQLSTMSKERCSELQLRGIEPRRVYEVPTLTIKSLNLQTKPLDPFLLCIDVEGAEMEVLSGADWRTFRPRVICVEDFGNPIANLTPMKSLLVNLGYQLISQAFLSSIYVHSDYLREGFFAKSLGLYESPQSVQSSDSSTSITKDEKSNKLLS